MALQDTRARRQVPALPIAAAALVLVAAGGGWWLTHPDRLPGVGGGSGARVAAGHRLFVGMNAAPASGTVHLDRVTPRVVGNTAQADFRVLLCHSADPHSLLGEAMDTAGRFCERPRDPHGADLPPMASGTYLVLEVTPHRPGTVRVAGLHVTYRTGWRRGTENSGETVTVRVTRGVTP